MSPPDLGMGEQSECNGLKERNYFELCDCSSVDSSVVPEENKGSLNLKATELRLGLPGSQSPEHDSDENGICPLLPKSLVSGNKRSFPEGNWIFSTTGSDSGQPNLSCNLWSNSDLKVLPKSSQECSNKQNCSTSKAQMVGWPPVRLPRKNTLIANSKRNDEVECKPGGGDGLFVKVSMDGAPYLRKVDLRMHHTYQDLSSALEKMFNCFIAAQGIPHGSEILKSNDAHGSEYVLTYEDKDGDWMLVGDVPWEMFIGSCKRLKIMKGCDAIGLAPGVGVKVENLK